MQIRFCKQILGSSFFGDAVDIDIHEEPKNELTTNLAAKGRICNSPIRYAGIAKNQFSAFIQKIIFNCKRLMVIATSGYNLKQGIVASKSKMQKTKKISK